MGFSEALIMVNFHLPDGKEYQSERSDGVPAIGMGYISEGGDRFRVVDVWIVDEKYSGGLNPYGVHVFLERASGEDDRPGRMYPEYYGQG